mmetsp:Transcript_125405/g.316024  ORF Transcript_125405/g.316024 Transcript_125405/m.316024 type:complete len:553 (-) Transcript_125405:674-2332(-)
MLELHIEVCTQRYEVNFQKPIAFDSMAEVIDVAGLGQVYQNGFTTFAWNQQKPARQFLIEFHLLAGQLLASEDLLSGLEVDLHERRLVHDIVGGCHHKVMAIVEPGYLVIGLGLQGPAPVELADVQLGRPPWASERGPLGPEAHRDQAVRVLVHTVVSAEGLGLRDGTAQVSRTDGAQSPGIHLVRQGVLVASQEPPAPSEDVRVGWVSEAVILCWRARSHLPMKEHLLGLPLFHVRCRLHKACYKGGTPVPVERQLTNETVSIDWMSQLRPVNIHDTRAIPEECTSEVARELAFHACSTRGKTHRELLCVAPAARKLSRALQLRWRHTAWHACRCTPHRDYSPTVEAKVVLHCNARRWLKLPPASCAPQLANQLGSLAQPGGSDWVALALQTTRGVYNYALRPLAHMLHAVGIRSDLPLPPELSGCSRPCQLERLVEQQLVGGEAIMQLNSANFLWDDAGLSVGIARRTLRHADAGQGRHRSLKGLRRIRDEGLAENFHSSKLLLMLLHPSLTHQNYSCSTIARRCGHPRCEATKESRLCCDLFCSRRRLL